MSDPECLNDPIPAPTLAPFQSAFTCSKLTIETLEQAVKYAQS